MVHKVVISLDVFSPTPLYQQLAEELKTSIRHGDLTPGERLPSIRQLAKQLQISTITVRQAIDSLIRDEIVAARHGSGNFVSDKIKLPASQEPHAEDDEPRFTRHTFIGEFHSLAPSIDWSPEARLLTRSCNDDPFHPWWDLDMDYEFRVGEPSYEFMTGQRWEDILVRWARECVTVPRGYTDSRGLAELRILLAGWLNRTRDLNCDPDDLFIISGAQNGRDLAARLLVDKGTGVVVEEPGSITDILPYETQGAILHHIRQDEGGIDVEQLQQVTTASVAHLATTANFPTGSTLSFDRRQSILQWADRNDVVIVEDSYGAGYYYDQPVPPPLYKIAKEQGMFDRIIYQGSLSQFITPALRLGFALVPKTLQKTYFRAKWLTERHPSMVPQELVIHLFKDGFFEENKLKLLQAARNRREAMLKALNEWPDDLISYIPVSAGFQQTIWFDKPVDDLLVFEKAVARHIGVIPLSPFYLNSDPKPGLSLNFLRLSEDKIKDGIDLLYDVVKDAMKESIMD